MFPRRSKIKFHCEVSQRFYSSLWFKNFFFLCHVPLVCITCCVPDLCAGSSVIRCSSNRGRTQEQVGKDDGVTFYLNSVNNWTPSRLRKKKTLFKPVVFENTGFVFRVYGKHFENAVAFRKRCSHDNCFTSPSFLQIQNGRSFLPL